MMVLQDFRINDLVTLTMTYILKVAILDSVATSASVFHKHILLFLQYMYYVLYLHIFSI